MTAGGGWYMGGRGSEVDNYYCLVIIDGEFVISSTFCDSVEGVLKGAVIRRGVDNYSY